ncbi:ATP-binding protein [Streptomyces sp. NPDC005529]|uniref:ATP-binding protein n=1 Tax=unclassified Streptomyces TaxID=2593676 RepID=UPI0033AAC903
MQEIGDLTVVRSDDLFVSRSRELDELATCACRAQSQSPVVVSLEGEAGIGKTALLHRFLAAMDGFTILRAACDPSETDMSFGVIGQLAARLPRILLRRYPVLMDLVAAPGISSAPALPVVGVQLRLLMDELLDAGPTAVVVDDPRWADRSSAGALRVALGRRQGEPLLVLMTLQGYAEAEDNGLSRALAGMGEPVHLSLEGLDPSGVAEFAARRTGHFWSRRAAEKLYQRTEGNPLHLELVLAEGGSPDGTLPVPGSLVTAMRSRLDALDVDSRHLVDALAVLNGFVSPDTAAAVACLTNLERAVHAPLRLGLVRWRGGGSGLIGIPHELQREAIYAALTPTRRRELHQAAALAVEGISKWTHRVAVAVRSNSASIAAELEEAAWERITTGDTERAATWLLWAADLAFEREDRERCLLTAVIQLLSGRRMDRALPVLESVRACAPSPLRDCALGLAAGYRGAYPSARAQLYAAMTTGAQTPGAAWVVAAAGNALAAFSCWQGHGEAALDSAGRVLASSTAVHITTPARISTLIAHMLTDGPHQALDRVNAGTEPWTMIAQGDAEGTPSMSYWHACLALAHITAAQHTTSEEHARRSLHQTPGAPTKAWSGDLAYFCLALGQYLRGTWRESAVSAERCLSIAEGLEHPWALARAHMAMSLTASARGDFHGASEEIKAARLWVRRVGPAEFEVYPAIAQAVLAQAQGDHQTMLEALVPLQRDPGGWVRAYRSWWLPLLAEALLGCDRQHEAAEVLRELDELARRNPNLTMVWTWLSGQLLQNRGALDRAADTYASGLTLPETSNAIPLYRARLAHTYAQLLESQGQEHKAITLLRQAHSSYQALNAAPFLTRCHHDLSTLLRTTPE